MAKKSSIEKNKSRAALVAQKADTRGALRAIAKDPNNDPEDRFEATLKLAAMPRNSSATRLRNRCNVTGRSRAYYRKFGLSRIAVRELGSAGQIPGLVKSSW